MPLLNPGRFVKVFGTSFVKDYTEHVVLTVGNDTWTRGELGRLGVVQARACSILSGIAKQLKVKSTRDLYDETSPHSLAEFPCGVVTLYVLFAIFLDKDLDPDAWYRAGKNQAVVTFTSLKHRELEARERERREQKSRNRSNQRRIHERDVAQLLTGTN